MLTDPISSSASSSSALASAASSATQLGKEDFLKLLMEQLKNQDPLNPVDNQAFIAQLAQFSSLEQLQSVSTDMSSLLTAQTTSNQMSMASWVGKNIVYDSNGTPTQGQVTAVRFDGSTPTLVVGATQVPLSSVLEITQP